MAKVKAFKLNCNNVWIENNYYKNKCKAMRKIILTNIYANTALYDVMKYTQDRIEETEELIRVFTIRIKDVEAVLGASAALKKKTAVVKKTNPRKKSKEVAKPKRSAPKRKKNTGENIQEPFTSGNVTIYNFGHIVYDTPFYYTDSAIYPGGYYATRTYAHFRNLFLKCTYHCKVIKAGSSPRFEIMDHDKHFKVTGLSTDECHSHLISLINKMLGTDDFIPANGNGDRFFGLTLPQVRFKLQVSPESKYCTGYIPLKSQFENYEAEMKAENDPSISFEGLHACLNKFRSRR